MIEKKNLEGYNLYIIEFLWRFIEQSTELFQENHIINKNVNNSKPSTASQVIVLKVNEENSHSCNRLIE